MALKALSWADFGAKKESGSLQLGHGEFSGNVPSACWLG